MSPTAAAQPGKTPRLTTDQARAQWAWELVKGGVDKDYVGLVKAVPTMIMGSGLLQTLAFLSAKTKSDKNKQHAELLCQLLAALKLPAAPPQAIEALTKLGSREYRDKTEEAMACLRWLRHFADVMKKGKE